MTSKKSFLEQKVEKIFHTYSFIYVFQHNTITADNWKKIKKGLHKISVNKTNQRLLMNPKNSNIPNFSDHFARVNGDKLRAIGE